MRWWEGWKEGGKEGNSHKHSCILHLNYRKTYIIKKFYFSEFASDLILKVLAQPLKSRHLEIQKKSILKWGINVHGFIKIPTLSRVNPGVFGCWSVWRAEALHFHQRSGAARLYGCLDHQPR